MRDMTLSCLQAGRAAAALAVTAFHLSLMMGEPRYGGQTVWWEVMQFGRLGVDFFFVLSGFVILHAHQRDIGHPHALPHYLWRRFVRLFPVYWLYTLAFVGLVVTGVGRHTQLPDGILDWISTATLVRLTPADTPLYVAWTLFHEVAFYGVFALLLLHRHLGLAVLATWGLVCLWLQGHPGQDPGSIRWTYLSVVNLEFLMGMGACLVSQRLRSAWGPLWVGLALLGLAGPLWPLEDARGYLLVGGGFSGLVCAMAVYERTRPLRLPRWWLRIGDASYSLYLLHLPLSGLVLKVLATGGLLAPGDATVSFALTLVATIAMSMLAFARIEAPLLAALHSLNPGHARRVGAAAQEGAAASSDARSAPINRGSRAPASSLWIRGSGRQPDAPPAPAPWHADGQG